MSKLNDLRKRGISLLTAAFTIVSLSGCTEVPEDYPEEFSYIEQDTNEFDNFYKTVIRNGESLTVYKGENIVLAINKETFDVKEYVYRQSSLIGKIYDLATGYMIVNVNAFDYSHSYDESNYNKLKEENYIVEFVNISDYLEDEELKEWYSLEEIKELEPKVIESLKIINEYESKVKVK